MRELLHASCGWSKRPLSKDDLEERARICLETLKESPRYGLDETPIVSIEKAVGTDEVNGQRIDWWVRLKNKIMIPINFVSYPSRPKKRELRSLIRYNVVPTVVVYAGETIWATMRKVAQSIKIGIGKVWRFGQIVRTALRRHEFRTTMEIARRKRLAGGRRQHHGKRIHWDDPLERSHHIEDPVPPIHEYFFA